MMNKPQRLLAFAAICLAASQTGRLALATPQDFRLQAIPQSQGIPQSEDIPLKRHWLSVVEPTAGSGAFWQMNATLLPEVLSELLWQPIAEDVSWLLPAAPAEAVQAGMDWPPAAPGFED